MATRSTRVGDYLLHPAVWGSIAVLLLNDHYLKTAHPGWLTGKLSDVAGLVFFPMIVAGVFDLVAHWRGRDRDERAGWRTVQLACLATGITFAAIQLFDWADWAFRHAVGLLQWPYYAARALLAGADVPGVLAVAHTQDVTDLIALIALIVPLWIARPRAAR